MKHKHYDMICAKAANMNLVAFKKTNKNEWSEIKPVGIMIAFYEDLDYFLCLPKHKEAVLNLLNGGDCQIKRDKWLECIAVSDRWSNDWWYMDEKCDSRIKPRKEKRWIGINTKAMVTTPLLEDEGNGRYVIDSALIAKHGPASDWQFIEIEVEVND